MKIDRMALLAGSILTAMAMGCGAGPGSGPEPPPPTATAPVASLAAPFVAPSAGPSAMEAAPPADGWTRRYYRIHMSGDMDAMGGVPVSIDVPPEWGVKL